MAKEIIHPRVKPLIEIFRGLPYVTGVTYNAGRYEVMEESGQRYTISEPLRFTFHVKDPYERRFEELVRAVLEKTSPPHNNVPVSVVKRYYLKPEQLPILYWYWQIEIDPVQGITGYCDNKRWEEDVKNTVSKIVDTVREYIAVEDL